MKHMSTVPKKIRDEGLYRSLKYQFHSTCFFYFLNNSNHRLLVQDSLCSVSLAKCFVLSRTMLIFPGFHSFSISDAMRSTQSSLLKVRQNYAFIFQIWRALHASSQDPAVPSGECSRNVWRAFCAGSDAEEKCDFQSWPKAPRAVNDCYDSMTSVACIIYFECAYEILEWQQQITGYICRMFVSEE